MGSKNGTNEKIHNLFREPGNCEAFALLYKLLSQHSRGFCLCQVQPKERLKILEFFDDDRLNERIQIIDMVSPLLGPMELQQTVIDVDKKFGSVKDIFFIYNTEECINLLKKSAEKFFQEMNLIRDFFMHFDALFVFFFTESSVKTMHRNAFDFYDWMKFTFFFTEETGDSSAPSAGAGEREKEKYSAPLEKIEYLENSLAKIKNEKARSRHLLELGQLYSQISHYDKALKRLTESLEIEEKYDDLNTMALRYNEIGQIHNAKGDPEAASVYFKKALGIYEKNNDRDLIKAVQFDIDEMKRLLKSKKKPAGPSKLSGAMMSDDFNWYELLERIRRRRVIPVVGHGLYWVAIESEGKKNVLLYDYLAGKIMEEIGEHFAPGENHRFAKACALFVKRLDGNYLKLSHYLKETISKLRLVPVGSLWKLGRIKAFNIFLTTAYDDFFFKILKRVREHPTMRIGYTVTGKTSERIDHEFFAAVQQSQASLLYHIFGRMENDINPAYTERDILETLLEFNKDMGVDRLNYLFQELRVSSLLFIGCGFDDWLYRMFIRIMANNPYDFHGRNRQSRKYITDNLLNTNTGSSHRLLQFLGDHDTGIFRAGGAGEFVDLLFQKLETAYPEEIIQPSDFPGTVFISFDGMDRAAAKQLADNLREDGIQVWLDEREFKAGESVDLTIMKAIDKSPAFIPLISENSRSMLTSKGNLKYHTREWERAITNKKIKKNVTIIPVIIDDTDWKLNEFADLFHFKIPGGKREVDYFKLKERLEKI